MVDLRGDAMLCEGYTIDGDRSFIPKKKKKIQLFFKRKKYLIREGKKERKEGRKGVG